MPATRPEDVLTCSRCSKTAIGKQVRYWRQAPRGWWVQEDGVRWMCGRCAAGLNPGAAPLQASFKFREGCARCGFVECVCHKKETP